MAIGQRRVLLSCAASRAATVQRHASAGDTTRGNAFGDIPDCRWPNLPSVTGPHDVSITAAGDPVSVTVMHDRRGLSEPFPPTSLPTPPPGKCWRVDIVVTGRGTPYSTQPPWLETVFVLRGDETATCDWFR